MLSSSYPQESGDHRYDGAFLLGSKEKDELVTIAPGLQLKLVDVDNSLSSKSGVLSIVFSLPEKNFLIALTNHDPNPTSFSHGDGVHGAQWYTFSFDSYTYRIIGTGAHVQGEQTYFLYRVTRETTQKQ